MKKLYIKPVTELVVVNLMNSVLQSVDIGGPSDVATGEASGNEGLVDLEEDAYDIPTSRSLWD